MEAIYGELGSYDAIGDGGKASTRIGLLAEVGGTVVTSELFVAEKQALPPVLSPAAANQARTRQAEASLVSATMPFSLPDDFMERHPEGTMEGWYRPTTFGPSAIVAHWITFLFLLVCTLYLARDSWSAKGPGGKELYYAGYHEEYNISLYVNLFAMMAYFGKVTADAMGHNYNNVGPLVIGLGNYRYADYMLTCPILAWDLMAQVRAPYKVTGAILIFCVLLSGTATNYYPGEEMRNGAIAWFCFGVFMYGMSYYLFLTIVKKQYSRLVALSANTEAKKAFMPLKLALYTFFSIWVVFPVVWILGYHGLDILSNDAQECLHCACDLVAKSFYGFALAKYRTYFDKKMWDMLQELGVDAEEGLDHLEQDLKDCDDPDKAGYKKMSMMASKTRPTHGFSAEPLPRPDHTGNFLPLPDNTYLRRPSFGAPLVNAEHTEDIGGGVHHASVDHLKEQLNSINDQLRSEYERKDRAGERKV